MAIISFMKRHFHRQNFDRENGIDPDDGNSRLCRVCSLSIFSTPFEEISTYVEKVWQHDRCGNLPDKLPGHGRHQLQSLILVKEDQPLLTSNISCRRCKKKCSGSYYQCSETGCNFRLDVLCASSQDVKILHRSHRHRLMVIMGSVSFVCGVCGTRHGLMLDRSYTCYLCDFWVHPDCVSLPNAIIPTQHHQHALFLTFNFRGGYDSDDPDPFAANRNKPTLDDVACAICSHIIQGSGAYCCLKCYYYAHVKCVVSDPQHFKQVRIRDAKLADLLHFPLADEHSSAICYIMENTSGGDDDMNHPSEDLHQHPLIFFHDDEQDGGDHQPRVCNACVRFISTPFYYCSQCPDFFLHNCCANLPFQIRHPLHKDHTLFLFSKLPSEFFSCKGCERKGNGFAYSCKDCDFTMDVMCALMPASITHEYHGKTHILSMSDNMLDLYQTCNCCNSILTGIWYDCSNCRHFKLHARCALLPMSIWHKYDEEHPLKLTTIPKENKRREVEEFCEICEEKFESIKWRYNCDQCDKSYHIHCINYADRLSNIKLGAIVHVKSHGCPLTLTREAAIYSYRCGICQEPFNKSRFPELAYECSMCYFGIHDSCAKKMLGG